MINLNSIDTTNFTLHQIRTFYRLRHKTVIGDNGCWLYQGSTDNDGHSTIRFEYKSIGIHRFSFHLFYKFDLNSSSFICHKPIICDMPNCWNPEHLYEGSAGSNNLDQSISGSGRAGNTHCKYGHKYTEQNTSFDKQGYRCCKECNRLKMQRRRNSQCQL